MWMQGARAGAGRFDEAGAVKRMWPGHAVLLGGHQGVLRFLGELGEVGPFGGHLPQGDAGLPAADRPGNRQALFRISQVFFQHGLPPVIGDAPDPGI